jgi:hypothetical protein
MKRLHLISFLLTSKFQQTYANLPSKVGDVALPLVEHYTQGMARGSRFDSSHLQWKLFFLFLFSYDQEKFKALKNLENIVSLVFKT